jgi:hypothetical protein
VILDESGERETLSKRLNVSEIFLINFPMAFLGPRPLGALPRHHIYPKAAAVIKQFRKADKKLYKNWPLL